MINIEFETGKIHKIDFKGSLRTIGKFKGGLRTIGRFKLGCGLTATGIIATKHNWHFTTKDATCEHCLKKKSTELAIEPTDLSNYHTFIKD